MKFSLSWLKQHLETTATLSEITQTLTQLGLVVDKVYNPAQRLQGFKVVEIVKAERHPQADRLQICQVETGEGILQVVCGAPNARAGLKSVLATPGLTIPSLGVTLKASRIRDVESQGMLCSERELGLSESHSGIMELPQKATVGQDYAVYCGLDDPVIDIEITPNRGDCLGVRGIARDLAATGLGQLKPLVIESTPGTFDSPIMVQIQDKTGCAQFLGRTIRGVKNGPSPLWLQQKLQAVGLKSISALVDVTNFIAFDRGRPLHVFDADTLQGNLVVRAAGIDEKFLALDDVEYTMPVGALVITDDDHICSLAGIMGGKASGCYDNTINVFLESALFDPIRIALAGREVGILSDARYRFERGVDPHLVAEGLEQATQMILELCGGTASHVVYGTEEREALNHEAFSPRRVTFSPHRVETLGGVSLPEAQIEDILTHLGFKCCGQNLFEVPTWRSDIKGEADLVEEVLRVIGYDSIPAVSLPSLANSFSKTKACHQATQNGVRLSYIRRCLAARGLSEAYTWSFLKEIWAQRFGGGDVSLKILNPISNDMSDMRPSLLPGLLEAYSRNLARRSQELAFFEAGHCYFPQQERVKISGVRGPSVGTRHWQSTPREVTLFDVKADVYDVLETLGLDVTSLTVIPEGPTWFHPGRVGSLMLGPKTLIAHFGEIHPQILAEFDIQGRVAAFEMDLLSIPVPKTAHKGPLTLSPYQTVERDFAFVMPQDVPALKLMQVIQKVDKVLIQNVSIFDVYEGAGVSEGYKSLGVSVRLVPLDKTFEETDIQCLSEKILTAASTQLGAVLRS